MTAGLLDGVVQAAEEYSEQALVVEQQTVFVVNVQTLVPALDRRLQYEDGSSTHS